MIRKIALYALPNPMTALVVLGFAAYVWLIVPIG